MITFAGGAVAAAVWGVGLTAVVFYIIRQHTASYTPTMGLGALCWLVGNALWLGGGPYFASFTGGRAFWYSPSSASGWS
ncbi:MAG: hypothetical protein H6656_11940 [Ardenticatenaceae bacterium]|nr:hypothetical protein [Ardenticatenaceae bacterium]